MKRLLGATLLTICSAMMLGVFSYEKTSVNPAYSIQEEVDSNIYGVQARSAGGDENYIVVQDANIETSYPGENNGQTDLYNAPNKIKIYLSQNDAGTLLSEIISNEPWTINRWSSGGVMFLINETNWNTYNGATIYKIEILEGCTYPNNKSQTVINKATKAYVNLNYGDNNHKNESFEWSEDANFEKSDQTLTLFGAEVRGDVNLHVYYIDVQCELYLAEPLTYYVNLDRQINAYEKILVCLSPDDNGTPLGELISSRSVVVNRWESQGFMFNLTEEEYDLYNGTTIYRIKVLEDCELVYQNKICKVASPITFTNADYGDPDAKNRLTPLLPPPPAPQPIDEPISLTGAQVRADSQGDYFFIDIISDVYLGTDPLIYDDLSTINAYDYIKVYLSEDDEGTYLRDVTALRNGEQNKWDSMSFLFALSEAEYEIYNGTTIYMIEVLKDCEIYVDRAIATVKKTYKFINGDYGNPLAKYEAFNFSMTVDELTNFGTVSLMGIHNRMDNTAREDPNCNRWLMILFQENIYSSNITVDAWIDRTNFLDNVLIYQKEDAEPITLRSIYNPSGTGITLRQFGETNMVGISISNAKDENGYLYDCAHMHSIVFNAGTQIPTFENGEAGYRLISEKTMVINDEYGLTGTIPNTIDDSGNLRLYEEWNLNWSVVRCLVTFTVVGIDGLTFPDISLSSGERIYLTEYQQDGYDLVATTEEGDVVYQCIIGGNHNFNIILTYSPHKDSGNKNNNNNLALIISIAAGATILVAGGVILTVILLKKRKEKAHA